MLTDAYLSAYYTVGRGINHNGKGSKIIAKHPQDSLDFLSGGKGVCRYTLETVADGILTNGEFQQLGLTISRE